MSDQLNHVRIASPCPTSWEQMSGDDRVRFCDLCNLHVYNIARLTRKEAEALIGNSGERICARLYRRADGTIITKDCPVGLRAVRRHVARVAGAVFATVVSLCGSLMGQKPTAQDKSACRQQVTTSTEVNQSSTTAITGTVVDPAGAIVAGTRVIIADSITKKTIETVSDNAGRFQVTGLPAGMYDLTVTSPGFVELEVRQITLKAKQTVNLDLTLVVSQELTGVIVQSEPSLPDRSMLGRPLLDRSPSHKVTFGGDMLRLPH